jgi:hypothetical protein
MSATNWWPEDMGLRQAKAVRVATVVTPNMLFLLTTHQCHRPHQLQGEIPILASQRFHMYENLPIKW